MFGLGFCHFRGQRCVQEKEKWTFPAHKSRSDEQRVAPAPVSPSRDSQCKYLNGGYGNSQHAL